MKLYALGTGGWIPTLRRQTCSYLLEDSDNLILLDTGSGISRLNDYIHLIERHDIINIIYSHYHIDHLIGLAYLPKWLNNKEIHIWGPGIKYYGRSCYDILSTITSSPYLSLHISNFAKNVVIKDYDLKGFKLNSGVRVNICKQQHSDPSFGITIGNFVHYATDTRVSNETFSKAKDVNLLLHECWDLESMVTSEHSSLHEILEQVEEYSINSIKLIHINPNWDIDMEKKLKTILEKYGNISILNDKDIVSL